MDMTKTVWIGLKDFITNVFHWVDFYVCRKECGYDLPPFLNVSNTTEQMSASLWQQQDLNNTSSDGLNISNPIIFYFKSRPEINLNVNGTISSSDDENSTNSTTEHFNPSPMQVIVYGTSVTLSNLEHYQLYNIEVCKFFHLIYSNHIMCV